MAGDILQISSMEISSHRLVPVTRDSIKRNVVCILKCIVLVCLPSIKPFNVDPSVNSALETRLHVQNKYMLREVYREGRLERVS